MLRNITNVGPVGNCTYDIIEVTFMLIIIPHEVQHNCKTNKAMFNCKTNKAM